MAVKMLFQSDYWVAANASERLETLRDFLETDSGIRSLVVIQKGGVDADLVQIMEQIVSESDLLCNVTLVLWGGQERTYKSDSDKEDEVGNITHMKTIYVCHAFDDYAVNLLRMLTPILALFV